MITQAFLSVWFWTQDKCSTVTTGLVCCVYPPEPMFDDIVVDYSLSVPDAQFVPGARATNAHCEVYAIAICTKYFFSHNNGHIEKFHFTVYFVISHLNQFKKKIITKLWQKCKKNIKERSY